MQDDALVVADPERGINIVFLRDSDPADAGSVGPVPEVLHLPCQPCISGHSNAQTRWLWLHELEGCPGGALKYSIYR